MMKIDKIITGFYTEYYLNCHHLAEPDKHH